MRPSRRIRERTGASVDLDHLPLDDEKTYELFRSGKTACVFQFDSSGMRDLLRRAKPRVFADLAALNALYRPGALDAGTVEDYVRRRNGTSKVTYPLPELEPILDDTLGILVYQEQVMRIASTVAGYSLAEADLLRKAIGKKKKEIMLAEGEKFIRTRGRARHAEEEGRRSSGRSSSRSPATVSTNRTRWPTRSWPTRRRISRPTTRWISWRRRCRPRSARPTGS